MSCSRIGLAVVRRTTFRQFLEEFVLFEGTCLLRLVNDFESIGTMKSGPILSPAACDIRPH